MTLARLTGIALGDLLDRWEARDLATLADLIDEETAAIKRAGTR